jgi:ComF family protein
MNLLDFIFPKNCLGCGKEEVYICRKCISKVDKPGLVCPECEKPSVDGFTHIRCQKKYGINGLISVWNYDGVVRKAILALKYKYATEIVNELANYLVTKLEDEKTIFRESAVLAPIPLHWYRENSRGFNQSEEIGKALAKKMGWRFISDLLIRKKYKAPQVTLKGDQRAKNIKGAFSLNSDYRLPVIGYRPVILFDDVFTTGSTLKEAAKVLRRGGCGNVWGLTAAR